MIILNVTKDQWVNGADKTMQRIGWYLSEQGLKFRYLPRAAPDGGTLLIIPLPMRPDKVQTRSQNLEEQIDQQMKNVLEQAPQESVPLKEVKVGATVRNRARKTAKEVDLTQLEEMSEENNE